MFDVGFSELLLIAVIGLLVLGPQRLPKAARMAGMWLRKARTSWQSVKAELERELADEELQRNLKSAAESLRESERSLQRTEAELTELGRSQVKLGRYAEPAAAPAAEADSGTPAALPEGAAKDEPPAPASP